MQVVEYGQSLWKQRPRTEVLVISLALGRILPPRKKLSKKEKDIQQSQVM